MATSDMLGFLYAWRDPPAPPTGQWRCYDGLLHITGRFKAWWGGRWQHARPKGAPRMTLFSSFASLFKRPRDAEPVIAPQSTPLVVLLEQALRDHGRDVVARDGGLALASGILLRVEFL